jgi:hypothetical protein
MWGGRTIEEKHPGVPNPRQIRAFWFALNVELFKEIENEKYFLSNQLVCRKKYRQ